MLCQLVSSTHAKTANIFIEDLQQTRQNFNVWSFYYSGCHYGYPDVFEY